MATYPPRRLLGARPLPSDPRRDPRRSDFALRRRQKVASDARRMDRMLPRTPADGEKRGAPLEPSRASAARPAASRGAAALPCGGYGERGASSAASSPGFQSQTTTPGAAAWGPSAASGAGAEKS